MLFELNESEREGVKVRYAARLFPSHVQLKISPPTVCNPPVYTPEELTALRRKERKAAKIERARLAVRAGQQLADGIVALGGVLNEEDEKIIERAAENELREEERDESAYGKHIPGLIYLKPQEKEQVVARVESVETSNILAEGEEEEEYIDVADMERLQLSSYETLFLAGMLGALQVVDQDVSRLEMRVAMSVRLTLLLLSLLPLAGQRNVS